MRTLRVSVPVKRTSTERPNRHGRQPARVKDHFTSERIILMLFPASNTKELDCLVRITHYPDGLDRATSLGA